MSRALILKICHFSILLRIVVYSSATARVHSRGNTLSFIAQFADIECGRKPGHIPRILNGETSNEGEFPWLVSIQGKNGHFCGGVIINSQYVLTAAHCFLAFIYGETQDLETWKVVVGSVSLNMLKGGQIYGVKRIIPHPKFTHFFPEFQNDVAVIELRDKLNWTEYVQPACFDTRTQMNFKHGVVAGWGLTSKHNKVASTVLKKTYFHWITNRSCVQRYLSKSINWNISSSHFCTSAEKNQTAEGDSGSAFWIPSKTSSKIWVAIGIVSGAESELPVIFTRISPFLPWISSIVT